MSKRFGGFNIFIMLAVLGGIFALAATSYAMMKSTGIVKFDAKIFADKFAAAYQQGDINALMRMYAPAVAVNGQNQTRDQLRPVLLKSLKGPGQSGSIQTAKPMISGNGFKETAPGKFSGKVTIQFTYSVGGKTKTANVDFSWAVARPESGGDWQIIETDRVSWDWGN